MRTTIGDRIIVIGSSCSGKSTFAMRLAASLGTRHIELDALHWEPGWQAAEREVFRERVREAVAAPSWVICGSYIHQQQDISWPVADTVIWIDLPLRVTIPRMVVRTWRRSRSTELIWGTNSESFWRQLKLWNEKDSLIAYSLHHDRERRERYLRFSADPRWSHIRFFRLCSQDEVERWMAEVAANQEQSDSVDLLVGATS